MLQFNTLCYNSTKIIHKCFACIFVAIPKLCQKRLGIYSFWSILSERVLLSGYWANMFHLRDICVGISNDIPLVNTLISERENNLHRHKYLYHCLIWSTVFERLCRQEATSSLWHWVDGKIIPKEELQEDRWPPDRPSYSVPSGAPGRRDRWRCSSEGSRSPERLIEIGV